MYQDVLKYLCCPHCRCDLGLHIEKEQDGEVLEGALFCENGHRYRIARGVADFSVQEQALMNRWETMAEETSFEELDAQMNAQNPEEIHQRRGLVLNTITQAIAAHGGKVILDIASGRGLLLAELLKATQEDTQIISIDLSSFVLRYDRKKFKALAPGRKISYLACDATKLPLKDRMLDGATTYGGISNMLGCAAEALREAHRVLKTGGILVDSYVVIEKGSQGCRKLQEFCREQKLADAEDFFLAEGLERHHKDLFGKVQSKIAFEGIGIDNGMDLLPYQDEWYAEYVYVSKK